MNDAGKVVGLALLTERVKRDIVRVGRGHRAELVRAEPDDARLDRGSARHAQG